MRGKDNHIIRLIMLAAGIILLLTVVIPHHHHADGLPCIHVFEDAGAAADAHHHTCDCVGHDLAFNSNILHDSGKHAPDLVLMPSFLGDIYDPLPDKPITSVYALPEQDTPPEPLHSIWIPAAAGLRAPPLC